jgi:F0F1-type ATP synthase beta subunit
MICSTLIVGHARGERRGLAVRSLALLVEDLLRFTLMACSETRALLGHCPSTSGFARDPKVLGPITHVNCARIRGRSRGERGAHKLLMQRP